MEREAVTIRFPIPLLKQAKQLKDGGESFNELVVEAVERDGIYMVRLSQSKI